jgi:hypothetical protein
MADDGIKAVELVHPSELINPVKKVYNVPCLTIRQYFILHARKRIGFTN